LTDDAPDEPYLQSCCVHCGRPHRIPEVIAVSYGAGRCAWCGEPGRMMTRDEYLNALTDLLHPPPG
jgi:hypothetical protein